MPSFAFSLAIGSRVELLLRKLRDEQSKTFELLRIENAVEELVEVVDGDELTLGNVAQILARRQKNRRRKLRQEMFRKIEIHIESFKSRLQLDVHLWKDHAADRMIHVRQWQIRKQVAISDFLGRHAAQLFPGDALLSRAVGPTGIGLPRVIFTAGSTLRVRS